MAALLVRFGGVTGLSWVFCAEAAVGLIIRAKKPSLVAPLERGFGAASSAAGCLDAGGLEPALLGGFVVVVVVASFLRVDGFR